MANKRHLHPHDYLSVSIPMDLIDKLRAHCNDTLTGKPKHGMQSKIVEALLNGYLAKQGVEIVPPAGHAVDTFEVSIVRPALLTPAQSKDCLEACIQHGQTAVADNLSADDLRHQLFTHPPIIRYQMPETL